MFYNMIQNLCTTIADWLFVDTVPEFLGLLLVFGLWLLFFEKVANWPKIVALMVLAVILVNIVRRA